MRPIDLLAFRVDDDHKLFLKERHSSEKNYKTKKCYEAYSWGRAENFQLGYPTLKENQRHPKLIPFLDAEDRPLEVSIRDVTCSDNFTLALSDSGDVYSWGCGNLGHLGNGSESSEIQPHLIKFNFKDEAKKIKQTKKKLNEDGQDNLQEMRFFRDFIKHASKSVGVK